MRQCNSCISHAVLHCVSKKLRTFKLSVTSSDRNRFLNFLHCSERMKFATKLIWHYPPHLRHVATLPWEIKDSIFSADIQQIWKKRQTNWILSAPVFILLHVSVYAECICVFTKILSSSLNTMLIVDKHCCDVCCDEFAVPQIDCKSKQVKEQWHGKCYLQWHGEKLAVLNIENT